MSRQAWEETLFASVISGVAVANTTTETIVIPNVTIPANYLQNGVCLRGRVIGQYSSTGTPQLGFGVRLGGVSGTVLCKSTAVTVGSSVTAAMWDLDFLIQVRSNGASGTIMANGIARVYAGVAATVGSATGAPAITPMTAAGVVTPAVATVDLSVDQALAVTATWNAASASNTLTALNYTIESMN